MSDVRTETNLDPDEEAARLGRVQKFKGSQVFARWYQEVFLPNGGRVYSNCLDGLWNSLEDEFFEWLDHVAIMRQDVVTNENKRKFEYWYKHVYKGKPSTEEDPRYDDDIWSAFVSREGYTYFLEDLPVDDRQGWDDIFENITLNGK